LAFHYFGVMHVTGLYNIFICDIMYNIQDHSGIFNSKIVSLVICEGFNLTHMWAVRESFGRVPQRAD